VKHLVLIAALASGSAFAQSIKIGELNSYKVFPAFLEPYKKGWELALEEINAKGGVLGRKLEVVSRDDGGTPGDAVRVAEELISRERANVLMGTFASNVGMAVANLAQQRQIVFMAAEPLTDKIVWENGNRYTFRLRPSTYMQVAMLVPEAAKLKKKRWAIVYPNYEYGQSAVATFKDLLKKAQPDVEFVADLAPPLGKQQDVDDRSLAVVHRQAQRDLPGALARGKVESGSLRDGLVCQGFLHHAIDEIQHRHVLLPQMHYVPFRKKLRRTGFGPLHDYRLGSRAAAGTAARQEVQGRGTDDPGNDENDPHHGEDIALVAAEGADNRSCHRGRAALKIGRAAKPSGFARRDFVDFAGRQRFLRP
jgi:hypothetical protein